VVVLDDGKVSSIGGDNNFRSLINEAK
jgi:hypothetical protein